MATRLKKYFVNTKSLVYAIAIHAGVVALLFVSFDWSPSSFKTGAAKPQVQPVKATMIDESEVKQQMDRLKAREDKKKQQELQAKQRLADLLKKQEQEKKHLADLKKKKQQEEKKAKALATKRKQEQLRLAKAKKEAQRSAKAKAEKQRKQREAEKRKAEKRKAEEKRRRQLAEKKKREQQARRKAQLKAQLEAEARARRLAQAVDAARNRYIPIIQQKVDRNWTRPSGSKGLNAGVRVRLTPSGEVISAKVVRSSGNPVFDRSVENAVLKASPLPIPRERGVNEKFRDIQFNFDPDEKLISLR